MRFGSLFAGIGGIDLGLERAGMECAWQVEIDDYCQRVLAKHWPDVKRYRDVREVGKKNLEPVDLIAGGFPCQPHSVAGKRLGEEDDRNLWPEFIRIIRETRPRYVLAENVPGIITTYLDTVLSDLEGEGYTFTTLNLPACGFDAPHRRERIFVVAYTNGHEQGGKYQQRREEKGRTSTGGSGQDVPDSAPMQRIEIKRDEQDGVLPQVLADTEGERLQGQREEGNQVTDRHGESQVSIRNSSNGTVWTVEPDVGRVAHGIPKRVDRLRGLGNAVVPQVVEWIGQRIIEHGKHNLRTA